MRIRRELGAALAGILTTLTMLAAMQSGRRSGSIRRHAPEKITNRLAASGGTTKATGDQLANPLRFPWLEAGVAREGRD